MLSGCSLYFYTTLTLLSIENLSLSMFPSVHTLFIYADALPAPFYNGNQPVQYQGISFWSTLVFMLRDTHFLLRHLYIRNVLGDLLCLVEDRVCSEEANTVLCRGNFRTLQLVRFTVVRGRTTRERWVAEMVKRVPNLHSRGILEVEMAPDDESVLPRWSVVRPEAPHRFRSDQMLLSLL